jgi:mono/diheme cytochrome c family protein
MADIELLALFNNVETTSDAINNLHNLGVKDDQITVMSGTPYKPEIFDRPHYHGRVGCAALSGAILGIPTAAILTIGLFLLYPIIQGGQPLVPVPPSLIVFFEVTMLGTMWAAFFGLLWLSGFPVFKTVPYDPRVTEGYIAVQVATQEIHAGVLEDAFMNSGAVEVKKLQAVPVIDQKFRRFWGSVGIGITIFAVISLLFFYDVFHINFPSNMIDQNSFGFEQGPRLAAPAESVPIQGPDLIAGVPASEPVPATTASLQRGSILFSINCTPCHGPSGAGNGKVAESFNPKPVDLGTSQAQDLTDDQIFLVITDGYGIMPSLAEHLSLEERWDVVNYIRTLKK